MRRLLIATTLIASLAACDDDDPPKQKTVIGTADGSLAEVTWDKKRGNPVIHKDGRKGRMTVTWDYVPVTVGVLTVLTLMLRRAA